MEVFDKLIFKINKLFIIANLYAMLIKLVKKKSWVIPVLV